MLLWAMSDTSLMKNRHKWRQTERSAILVESISSFILRENNK